jgi:hypothetical protein
MRKSDAGSFQVATEETADRLTLTIDAVKPDGSFHNELPITVNAVGANEQTVTQAAVQVGPGRYTATFDLPEIGTTIFNVSSPDLPDGGHTFGHTRSYPREFLSTETNEPLLARSRDLGAGSMTPLLRRSLPDRLRRRCSGAICRIGF